MDYDFSTDFKAIREILGMTQEKFASELGVQRVTLSRSELGTTKPSDKLYEQVYSYAFEKGIKLGRLKEMFCLENMKQGHKLLFHGAKNEIEGPISVNRSRTNNDFGQGFYTGESYSQAISFVSGFDKSSVYFLDFDSKNLVKKQYTVNRDWMLTIAYFRGALDEYYNHPIIKRIQLNMPRLAAENINADALAKVFHDFKNQEFIVQYNERTKSAIEKLNKTGAKFSILFDASGGNGILPEIWQKPVYENHPFGYSGGISPENVSQNLDKIQNVTGKDYETWIDAEGRLKSLALFDEKPLFDVENARAYVQNANRWMRQK